MKELVALGHVEVVPNVVDRRNRPVRLSATGHAAVQRARATRARFDAVVADAVGVDEYEHVRRVLVRSLEVVGIDEQVRQRRVPPADGQL